MLDVTDAGSVREAVARAKRAEGVVSVLINNAGFGQAGTVEEVPLERVRRQFETNVCGIVKMGQLELPGTRCQGSGRIVNLSSMSDRLTFPGGGFYHATKHAVEAISDALRFEVMGFGIQVMVIEPGLIRTRFSEFAIDSMGEGTKEGPYTGFHAAVERATRGTCERGLLSRPGGGPEVVARTIGQVISSLRPPSR